MCLPPLVHRFRRHNATSSVLADVGLTIERPLELLRCLEVLKVLRVRGVSSLFLQEIIDAARHQLQMLQPAPRHRSGLAKSPDRVGTEIIKCV